MKLVMQVVEDEHEVVLPDEDDMLSSWIENAVEDMRGYATVKCWVIGDSGEVLNEFNA